MTIVPLAFPQPSEAAVASYDWTDIAEGTGIVLYHAYVSETSTGDDNHISTAELYSRKIETTATTGSASYALIIEKDFDLTAFNTPRTIKGTATVTMCMAVNEHQPNGAVAGGVISGYVIARVKKGTTEIASAQSQTISLDTTGVPTGISEMINIPITIPITHFKIGEILRLAIEGWGKKATTYHCRLTIGNDPMNRDGTYIKPSTDDPITVTKMDLYCPYKIEL